LRKEDNMQELLQYVELIKQLTASKYGKDVLFYDVGNWYSREHCREITLEELQDFVMDIMVEREELI